MDLAHCVKLNRLIKILIPTSYFFFSFSFFFRTLQDASLQVDQQEPITGRSGSGASQLNTDGVLWLGKDSNNNNSNK